MGDAFAEALIVHNGFVTHACQDVNVTKGTIVAPSAGLTRPGSQISPCNGLLVVSSLGQATTIDVIHSLLVVENQWREIAQYLLLSACIFFCRLGTTAYW